MAKSAASRVLADDRATAASGWPGFSEPVSSCLAAEGSGVLKMAGLVFALALLLLLPPLAACMLAALRGVTGLLDLTAIAFAILGCTGYSLFWIYFFSHVAGISVSYALIAVSGTIVVIAPIAQARRAQLRPLKQMIVPALLVLLASIFILSVGLLHGDENDPLSLAGHRFHPPSAAADNQIPKQFADAVFSGNVPKPLHADWLSSDRPPLQTGNILSAYAWTSGDRVFVYLVLSVILQCSFLAPLWSFLTVCEVGRRPLVLAVTTCLFSGFTFFNGFYTWPKLYPTAFLLIVAAYLLTGRFSHVRDRADVGALVGTSAALAMLCHGGSMFGILGIATWMIVWRRYPQRKFCLGLAAAFITLYTPWILYQKLCDPPGDRLLKYHLAGVIPPHPELNLTDMLRSQYGSLTVDQLIHHKVSNFQSLTGDPVSHLKDVGGLIKSLGGDADTRAAAAIPVRLAINSYWVQSLGLASLGPLALVLARLIRRSPFQAELIGAFRMWCTAAITIVLWCLIMFGPNATMPHQGTYLTEILAFTGSALAFWALAPRLAVAMTGIQVLLNITVFVWLTPGPTGVAPGVVLPDRPVFALLALLSAAAIFAMFWAFDRGLLSFDLTVPSAAAAAAAPFNEQSSVALPRPRSSKARRSGNQARR